VVRVEGAADERAPAAVYLLDAVDLGDELDGVVAGVREGGVLLAPGARPEHPPPAIVREEDLGRRRRVVPHQARSSGSSWSAGVRSLSLMCSM
jgi:hypothetical protein